MFKEKTVVLDRTNKTDMGVYDWIHASMRLWECGQESYREFSIEDLEYEAEETPKYAEAILRLRTRVVEAGATNVVILIWW